MAKKKHKTFGVDKNTDVTLTVVALDPVRDKLARLLLALIGLRNVLFVSADKPIQEVLVKSTKQEAAEDKPKAKTKAKKKA